MPIPKYDGSPESEWISSCMHEIGTEYDQEQALAICYKQMEMSKQTTQQRAFMNISKLSQWKGINLAEDSENPCWDGYEQIGTKELDGRTVPNCVPVKE